MAKFYSPQLEQSLRGIVDKWFAGDSIKLPIKNGEKRETVGVSKMQIAEFMHLNIARQLLVINNEKAIHEYKAEHVHDKLNLLRKNTQWSGWNAWNPDEAVRFVPKSEQKPATEEIAVLYWFYYLGVRDTTELSAYRESAKVKIGASPKEKEAALLEAFEKGITGMKKVIEQGFVEELSIGPSRIDFREFIPSDLKSDDLKLLSNDYRFN